MNRYLKQFLDEYSNRLMWDIRARKGQKAMLIPLKEWLSILNNPTNNDCMAAYRSFNECCIQGIITKNSKYFIYEGTSRYSNVYVYSEPVTFIFIDDVNKNTDSLGFSKDFLYIRNTVPDNKKNVFSNYHTYCMYNILKGYKNFSDIESYPDFLSRYTNSDLCRRKGLNLAIETALSSTLKTGADFNNLEWTCYKEVVTDEFKADFFYHDFSLDYIKENSQIWLDGGIYE